MDIRSLWCHNMRSYSRLQTNVLAKFVCATCMLFYTHSPYSLLYTRADPAEPIGTIVPPKTYESNYIHHDFENLENNTSKLIPNKSLVTFERSHRSRWKVDWPRCRAIPSSIVLSQQCCEVYFICLSYNREVVMSLDYQLLLIFPPLTLLAGSVPGCTMCHCSLQVRRQEQNTALNAKTEQFIAASISDNALQQGSRTNSVLRQRSSQVHKYKTVHKKNSGVKHTQPTTEQFTIAQISGCANVSLKLPKIHKNWECA